MFTLPEKKKNKYFIYMEAEFIITKEQVRDLEHYTEMFKMNAEYIQGLCSSEKDDIVYGYELGKMHSHLLQCFMEMQELTISIKNNKNHE